MLTSEQEHVVAQSVLRGIVKNHQEAYEAGCSALRRQLQELTEEESAKHAAAARAEAQVLARDQVKPF